MGLEAVGREGSAAAERDDEFTARALELGLVREDQIRECREIQKRMEELGLRDTLSAILVKKGYLDQAGLTRILAAMGEQIQPIPGYEILGCIGEGGSGRVYRARQISMDRPVALKILAVKDTRSKAFIDRFFREARAAARLNHRNIIQAYDAGHANGLYYFAMELVEGESARSRLRRQGPFAEEEVLEIALQVCDALAYIHRHGLIHRDIKPENLLFAADGTVKLCDFGLAKSEGVEDLTLREGYTVGSPYYMSPEQISGCRDLDIRSDLYSLGATMYTLLTGKHVFEGKEVRQVFRKHLFEVPRPPSEIVRSIRRGMDQVVLKLLEKDPGRRYSNPGELARDLRKLRQGARLTLAVRLPKEKKLAWIAGGSAAAALLLAAGTVLWFGGSDADRGPDPGNRLVQDPVRETPPSREPALPRPGPSPAPEKDAQEVEAESLFRRAERTRRRLVERAAKGEDRAEEWIELRGEYRRLERDYAATEFFAARREQVWERMEECRRRHTAVLERQRAESEAEAAALRKAYAEAVRLLGAARWEEAAERFQVLLGCRLPPEISRETIEAHLGRCERERMALDLWGRLSKLHRERKWGELAAGMDLFRSRFGDTETGKQKDAELKEWAARCERERAAAEAIHALRKIVEEGRWEEASKKLVETRRAYGDTDAYRGCGEEIAGFEVRIREGLQAPLEKRAQAVWADLGKAVQEGNLDRAEKLLASLQEEPLSKTAFVASVKGELAKRRAWVEERRSEQLERQAAEIFKEARRLARRGKPEDAHPLYQKLLEDEKLSKTRCVQRQRKYIERDLRRIRVQVEELNAALVEDFEAGLEWKWVGKGKKGKIEPVEEAWTGMRAARIGFVGDREGTWSLVRRPCEAPPKGALGVAFYARAVRPQVVRVRFQLRQGEGGTEAVFRAERDVGTAWSEVRIGWAEFRLVWSSNKRKPPRFDPWKVRAIEFSRGPVDSSEVYLVDRIRFILR